MKVLGALNRYRLTRKRAHCTSSQHPLGQQPLSLSAISGPVIIKQSNRTSTLLKRLGVVVIINVVHQTIVYKKREAAASGLQAPLGSYTERRR